MLPSKIMLIRHAEKPEKPQKDGSAQGVDLDGKQGSNNLTVRGWQRAGALAGFFAPADGRFPHAALSRPAAIFAADAKKADKSVRSVQTVSPLAELLGIRIDHRFKATEEDRLVAALQSAVGAVLIAWEHDAIAHVVDLITEGRIVAPAWPENRFDLVWVVERIEREWRFTQVPQQLLAGDSSELVR